MIFDTLKNANRYFLLNPAYESAFAFIKRAIEEKLPVGKYELDGDRIYAMVQEYDTKCPEDSRFEAHRKYIDVQYIISGVEVMQVIEIAKATPATEYNEEKDFAFYQNAENAVTATMTAEDFAIFLPHDVHRPSMAVDNKPSPIKKIVVKIKA